jgi:2-amino-4-hydroxy-6-hydroxymethyldihydropteridine diphosphokinase
VNTSTAGQLCYLGLGSNLNNPQRQLRQAIRHLNRLSHCQVIASSDWLQSKAWGVTDQPDFINAVIAVRTRMTPLALLKALKIIEYRVMNRQVNARWHSRVIDLDILLYGQHQLNRPQLQIPHPLIAERCFVWAPLLTLKPVMPVQLKQKTAKQLRHSTCQKQLHRLNRTAVPRF